MKTAFWAGVLCVGIAATNFMLQAWHGLMLQDEGYLWYGAQRVLAGEVPMRDFMAYDPARYYWSAFWMGLWGDNSVLALRFGQSIVQAAGLGVAVWLFSRAPGASWGRVAIATLLVAIWMLPRYKVFDSVAALGGMAGLTLLLEKPVSSRFFAWGVIWGLVAFVGRNHALYLAIGTLCALGYVGRPSLNVRALGSLAAGMALGYLPMIALFVFEPGSWQAFIESLDRIAQRGSTDLALPVPWPWRVNFNQPSEGKIVAGVLCGLAFIAVGAFALTGLPALLWRRLKGHTPSAPTVAAACLAPGYAHYAFSRADIEHLATGMIPLWVLTLNRLVIQGKYSPITWALLLVSSLLICLPHHPGWVSRTSGWQPARVGAYTLRVDSQTLLDLKILTRFQQDFAPNHESLLIAPYWPGAYAVLNQAASQWAIYALWPRRPKDQQKEIQRLKARQPSAVLLLEDALDHRPELTFARTHPQLLAYIEACYERLPEYIPYPRQPGYRVYRLKNCDKSSLSKTRQCGCLSRQ